MVVPLNDHEKDTMSLDIEKDAKELLAAAKKERLEASKKAESKGAAPVSSTENKKTEGKEPEAEVEAQVAKDKEILSKKDDELNDEEKARKSELSKIEKKVEAKDEKSNVQKRFDELTAKIKHLEADNTSTKSERDAVKAELMDIKKELSITPEDKMKENVKKEMSSRTSKYLDEDKTLPNEQRREMTKDELEAWMDEDRVSAQEWVTKRTIRRYREEEGLQKDAFLTHKTTQVMNRFNSNYEKLIIKHPEMDISKRRSELEKEGMSKDKIRDKIAEENPKWKIFMEIFEADQEKYLMDEQGPQKITAQMEKRLAENPEPNTEVEKLKKELEELKAENKRLEGLDTDISSSRQVEPSSPSPVIEKEQVKLGKELGLDEKRLKTRIEERKKSGR